MSVTIDLSWGGVVLYLITRWQKETSQWTMTIQDEEGNDVLSHIPLVSNIEPMTGNLLRVYAYKMLGAMAVVPKNEDLWGVDPGRDSLNENYEVIWGDTSD